SAAPKISRPSKPLAKYSALPWPNGWPASAGVWAMVTIASANSAAARLTSDSIASDSSPTESVSHQASVFSAMVASAAATDSRREAVTDSVTAGGCSRERHPCEAPLADLHDPRARSELQPLVADHGAVDAHATLLDQAQALAAGGHEARLLEQRADRQRG